MRENHYAVLVIFENFSGFHSQEFSITLLQILKCLEGSFPLFKCKNMKNVGSAIIFPAFFMLAHKYL